MMKYLQASLRKNSKRRNNISLCFSHRTFRTSLYLRIEILKIYKLQYNPKIHHRRSIRLKGYDYSSAGLYFITICCQDMKCRFGKIEHNEMTLNEFGLIAQNEWGKLPERFPNFELDVFQIMPNHMHGIISVGAGFTPAHDRNNNNEQNGVGAGFTPAQNIPGQNNQGETQGISPTIGDIVDAYKSW